MSTKLTCLHQFVLFGQCMRCYSWISVSSTPASKQSYNDQNTRWTHFYFCYFGLACIQSLGEAYKTYLKTRCKVDVSMTKLLSETRPKRNQSSSDFETTLTKRNKQHKKSTGSSELEVHEGKTFSRNAENGRSTRRRSSRGNSSLSSLAHAIARNEKVLFITGAGLSVNSGIKPFRGVNGVWNEILWRCVSLSRLIKS